MGLSSEQIYRKIDKKNVNDVNNLHFKSYFHYASTDFHQIKAKINLRNCVMSWNNFNMTIFVILC